MKINYRPEIDGLRAIAVGAVILYHAQITIFGHQPFKGGFIGVDIFFVISGYLITSIILKELVTTGSFSFKYFYERRVRRILPALLFVMLVSLPFAWTYLLPNSFVDFSKSILYSLGFSSNFYFYYSGQQYGAEGGLLKPFLHTWSLSVEEQFYIFFPIVLLVTFKYFRKYLAHILILGFIISLGLAEWGSRNYPSFNFYVLPTRGWELLAGSILAYFEINNGHRSQNKTLNLILPKIGFFLIIFAIVFFKLPFTHPSLHAIPLIVGVCLIIWFSDKNELVTKILSTKLFVGVGLISYSLYLWHYPIFAFDRIVEFTQISLFKKSILGITIIILSVLTYYLVERPARSKNNKFKAVLSLILISVSLLIIINLNTVQEKGYKNRLPEILSKNLSEDNVYLLKNSEGKTCFKIELDFKMDENIERCKFNISSNKKVYLIGDSHLASIMFDLKNRLVKKNYQFIPLTVGGCLYFPGFNKVEVRTNKINENCSNNYFQKLKKKLINQKNSLIIFGGRFPLYFNNSFFDNQEFGVEGYEFESKFVSVSEYDNILSSLRNEVLELSKNNKIIIIYPIPEVGWNVPRKLLKSIPKQNNLIKDYFTTQKYITTSYEVYKKRTKSSFELLDSIQVKNIYRVYPHKLFCDTTIKDRCVSHDDKNIFYVDDDHPSLKGAEMINDLIMKEIEKIEHKSE